MISVKYPRFLFVIAVVAVLIMHQGRSFAAQDPVKEGMKLIGMHRYGEAAELLSRYIRSGTGSEINEARLALGIAYQKNAELHRELYKTSLAVNGEYLGRLAEVRGKARSHYVNLYLGEALLELGQPKRATRHFNKCLNDKKVSSEHKDIARVGLGYAHFLDGDAAKAKGVWSGIKSKDPEVRSRLAFAYARAGVKDSDPVKSMDSILTELKSSGKQPSDVTAMNALGVYIRAGMTEKALEMAGRADLKTFAYEESLGKNKSIRFYDITLLDSLASLYGRAAIDYLEKVRSDKKNGDVAVYYMAESYLVLGEFQSAAELVSSLLSSKKIPDSLRERLKVNKVYLDNMKNKGSVAFLEFARSQPARPEIVREILVACDRMRIECTDTVLQASTMVEKERGRTLSGINYALGLYYLGRKDADKSVLHLEAARDKSNKNSIAHNEPIMLTHIADAYYGTKQYSEALEILFSLSDQFPSVRQIQEAMQGVYMREQKSAGDVKIL